MSDKELRDFVKTVRTLGRRLHNDGPQTDDELHAWVLKVIGVDIPRVAVCEDHDPPFRLLADAYFERLEINIGDQIVPVSGVLVLANRGGGKTFIVAIIHYLNATFKPGCEGLQFGATEAQGNRCYDKIEDWCYEHDDSGSRLDKVRPYIDGKPMRSLTKWRTGGRVEVVAGSVSAVSGPHPQKAGADEIDDMERPVWNQSRGMAVAKKATGPLPPFMDRFNGVIPPMDIASSTRNSLKGLMHEMLVEVEQDVKQGNVPQFSVIKWCIWETLEEVPHCRAAPAHERKKRLKELGREPDELCYCNKVVKGVLPTGEDRTLEKVCAGKAFKARGYKPYIDLVATFKRNTPGTWMLQHECREGQDENNYIQDWALDLYGIRAYEPRPEFGPIYNGIDWGGTNPYCSLWFQYLTADVPAYGFDYEPIYLNAGIYVLFKEVYVANVDTPMFYQRVDEVERSYRMEFGPAWKVAGRFMDPQGRADRNYFRRKGKPGAWPVGTRDKDQMIGTVQNLVIDDRFTVDVDEAPMFCEEVEGWQKNPKNDKEVDKRNHAMAAWRYGIANAERIHETQPPPIKGQRRTSQTPTEMPRGFRSGRIKVTAHSTLEDERGRRGSLGPVGYAGGQRSHPLDNFAGR